MGISKDLVLKIILVISIAGILFSGFLSFRELSTGQGSCSNVIGVTCGIADIPPCVYGLAMYSIIFVLSLLGLKSKK
ncbi:MAG: hypothetical protein NTZ73_00120 [Candidatus Diapherotrites archaeon]|nr:hypothetical protein [Candidatus Diapherotrites archaeon]